MHEVHTYINGRSGPVDCVLNYAEVHLKKWNLGCSLNAAAADVMLTLMLFYFILYVLLLTSVCEFG